MTNKRTPRRAEFVRALNRIYAIHEAEGCPPGHAAYMSKANMSAVAKDAYEVFEHVHKLSETINLDVTPKLLKMTKKLIATLSLVPHDYPEIYEEVALALLQTSHAIEEVEDVT